MSSGTMKDDGSVATEPAKRLNPLGNEKGRENDESACFEVGKNEAKGENGLAKAHFITNETAANVS